MKLLQILPPDSAGQIADTVTEVAEVVETSAISAELWVSIVMPIILLVICSVLKHTLAVGPKKIQVFDLISEMAVDLLPIFGAFIIGRFFLESSSTEVLLLSSLMVGIIAVVTLIVTILRRIANHWIIASKPKLLGAYSLLTLEYVLDVFCVFLIFKI